MKKDRLGATPARANGQSSYAFGYLAVELREMGKIHPPADPGNRKPAARAESAPASRVRSEVEVDAETLIAAVRRQAPPVSFHVTGRDRL